MFVKPDCTTCPQAGDLITDDMLEFYAKHGLSLSVWCNRCSKGFENIDLEAAEILQSKKLGLAYICKECGDMFIIHPDELVWLLSNNLQVFKRCPACRKKNYQRPGQQMEFAVDVVDEIDESKKSRRAKTSLEG